MSILDLNKYNLKGCPAVLTTAVQPLLVRAPLFPTFLHLYSESFPRLTQPYLFKFLHGRLEDWVPHRVVVQHVVHVHGLLPEEPDAVVRMVFLAVGTGEPVHKRLGVVEPPAEQFAFLYLHHRLAVWTGQFEYPFLAGLDEPLDSWFYYYHMFFLVM